MRLAYYTGASTALAGAVALRAFHERPNFYSACVYLSQSNACLMILTNLSLLCAFFVMFGLQRLFFGPLRAIEVEQLYDKAWIAVTETCLAMTMFREHIGAWFLVMFVSLLAGKVWEWIGEGRVEFLEQQPPANPRVFHTRLSSSLVLSVVFDILMLKYCIMTVVYEARPGMMVMFAFEFALLALLTFSTAIRYGISLIEGQIVKRQTQERITARKAELKAAREAAERDGDQDRLAEAVAEEQDFDEEDIDVPGWETKGRWIFYLDLATDFIKLVVYMVFFIILLIFHGLPIHILRDVFYTMRSFVKRIHDFAKYRDATRDMNSRYPDATAEDLERDDTCIICREEMRLWQPPANEGQQGNQSFQDERFRPKKLPCGHTLHFNCLRSWLERQQVCPICRRSVLATDGPQGAAGAPGAPAPGNQQAPQGGPNAPVDANRPGQQPQNQGQNQGGPPRPQPDDPNRPNLRVFHIGPFRLAFGAGPENQLQNMINRFQNPGLQPNAVPVNNIPLPNGQGNTGAQPATAGSPSNQALPVSMTTTQQQLNAIETRLRAEQDVLRNIEDRLLRVQRLNMDVNRRRAAIEAGFVSTSLANTGQGFSPSPTQPRMGPGDPNLPPGVVVPEGWSLLPLRRAPEPVQPGLTPGIPNFPGFAGFPGVASAPISRRVSHERLGGPVVNYAHGSFVPPMPPPIPQGMVPTPTTTIHHPTSGLAAPSMQPPVSSERQGRSPSPAPARPASSAPGESVSAAPRQSTPAPAAASASALPDWSFVDRPGESGESEQAAGDSSGSSTAEAQDKEKGKSKAATVEDEDEDDE